MAKRRKSARPKHPLPVRGEAFLMPLEDGRWGVCRVIRQATPKEQEFMGAPCVHVVGSSWIGAEAPEVNDPRLRAILNLNHHSWQNKPNMLWTFDPVPDTFRRLGLIEPTPSEEQLEGLACGSWLSLPGQVLLQWRWDYDREALLLEEERARIEAEHVRQETAKRHAKYLAGLTLERLKKKRLFTEWKDYISPKVIRACRDIFRDTIDDLILLGPKAKKRTKVAALRRCIDRLNDLDEEHEHFICTVECEDLCDVFYEVAHAAGLKDCEDLADEWRDW